MNYELRYRMTIIMLALLLVGCCGSVELNERIIEDEIHKVPADTILITQYIDTSGNAVDYLEQLYFSPNPNCDTAAIVERYANINLSLKKKNADLWLKFNGLKRKLEFEIKTKPKEIIDRDTVINTKYIEKKSFIDDIKWFVIIGIIGFSLFAFRYWQKKI